MKGGRVPDFATLAGHVARFLAMYGVGLLGAACIVLGLYGVDWRVGLIGAGVLLLFIDRKVP